MIQDLFVLNDSPASDDDLRKWVAAIQTSLAIDFAPIWNASAVLHVIGKGGQLPAGAWGGVLSGLPQSEYLGEHHLENVPRFVVSLPASIQDGAPPSSVLDHEIKELIGDPDATLCDEQDDGTLLAYEACDPVEGGAGAYEVDGVTLENFVLPLGYFRGKGDKYDFRGILSAPQGQQLAPGGYQLIKKPGGNWDQITGEHVRASKLQPWKWSRRGRRMARAPR